MPEDDKDNGNEESKMPDVSPEEALAAFMKVDPEKVREAEGRERSNDDENGEESE